MPLTLPSELIAEKNKLYASGAFLEAIDIEVSELSETYRAVKNTGDVIYKTNTYNKFEFEFGAFVESGDSSGQIVELKVSNVNRVIENYVKQTSNGLVGDDLIYRLIHSDHLTANPAITINFTILSVEFDLVWATFTLGTENFYFKRFPLNTYSRNICRYHLQDKFKGDECGYSGGSNWCDYTFQRCNALENLKRFGGQPSIPNGQFLAPVGYGQNTYVKWGADAEYELFTGNEITVGPSGYDYTNPESATDAAVSGDMVKIYPGSYDVGSTWYITNKDIIIRGMGDLPSDVYIYNQTDVWHVLRVDGNFTRIMVENVRLRAMRLWAGAIVHDDCTINANTYINKCRLEATASGYTIYYGASGIAGGSAVDYKGSSYITNCSLHRGYATYLGIGRGVGSGPVEVTKCQYNVSYYCYQCLRSPSPHDYVIADTAEYGENYGESFVLFETDLGSVSSLSESSESSVSSVSYPWFSVSSISMSSESSESIPGSKSSESSESSVSSVSSESSAISWSSVSSESV